MPGTMAVFGAAYQNMLAAQGKGGGLTGQAAVAALLEAVPTGRVQSAELLPFVSEEMQVRAAPKLDIARETSQGWQGRLANQRTGWAMIASESGLEEGQRNFFKFFTQWMNENQQIPQKFGEMWEKISEQFVIAGGFGSLLRSTLGGRDTIFKEWLGEERTEQLREDFDLLAEKARAAAGFLGLLDEKEEGKGFWRELVERGAAFVGTSAAVMEGDFGRAKTEADRLLEGAGDAYLRRMPHLRAAGALRDKYVDTYNQHMPHLNAAEASRDRYLDIMNPVRSYGGNAIPWMNHIGRQPWYYPRGDEPLTNTPTGVPFRNVTPYGEDHREIPRSIGDIIGEMGYNSPSADTLVREAGVSLGQGETINVGGITIHATSSEPEAIKEAVEEVFREGLPPRSR